MVIGLGLDLVEIERIKQAWQRFGLKFAEHVLHQLELEQMQQTFATQLSSAKSLGQSRPLHAFMAARFAAKEATVKALGTGISVGIGFKDMYVQNLPSGQPQLFLLGKALTRMQALGATDALLSLTHSRYTAAAVVVLAK
ncbi:MAG: holo-ACP synthase [Deltaproteobacteria bacterium]|jgi:holo-[acyl-carrier protein] synthase|nr:holo-ACP synthase [Deltaproteobacteria bacterium]